DRLDQEGALARQVFDDLDQMPVQANVKLTFETGIEQIYGLIERNPDKDYSLSPNVAFEVIDSQLIIFDPDSWLSRASELEPIRTHRKDVLLPIHVRLRVEEL